MVITQASANSGRCLQTALHASLPGLILFPQGGRNYGFANYKITEEAVSGINAVHALAKNLIQPANLLAVAFTALNAHGLELYVKSLIQNDEGYARRPAHAIQEHLKLDSPSGLVIP